MAFSAEDRLRHENLLQQAVPKQLAGDFNPMSYTVYYLL